MPGRMEQAIEAAWREPRFQLWWRGQWLTSDWLFETADRLATRLGAAGFGPGQRLATLMPVCPAFNALSLACWRLGGTIVPLNASAGMAALTPVLRSADAALVVICPELAPYQKFFEAQGEQASVMSFLGEVDDFVWRPSRTDELGDRRAVIFFTSGTTGQPKGVPLTHENLLFNIQASIAHAITVGARDVMLNVLPNFHALGCVVSGWLPLVAGFGQAMVSSFLPVNGTIEAVATAGVTLAVMVPTMLHFFVGALAKSGVTLPSLELMICGGDRLAPELEARARTQLGVRLVEGYGLTEASPVLAVTSTGSEHRTGTVGTFLPGVEYRLVDADGVPVSGNEGELWVRGPSIAENYFRDQDNTAQRFKDGWLDTDDLVRVDTDGTVSILERASDLIIVGGFNVYPQEVEAVLVAHPAVKQAGVVGYSQSMSGEVVRAFVVLVDGATVTARELEEWCRERLPHYKVPRRVEILRELPVNPLGKVMRRKLRDLCKESG